MNSRTQEILKIINSEGSVVAADLSDKFNVSIETIRRDLNKLDVSGDIIRIHGGAVSNKSNDIGTSFESRLKNHIEAKQDIVEKIIPQLFEGAVIGLDASSSCWHFAKSMPNMICTVVTNSMNVINALEHKGNISIIGVGGSYSTKYASFYGSLAKRMLDRVSLDFCLISCDGFDISRGFWESNEYNLAIKQKMIEVSDQVIILADETKFNKKSLLKLCGIELVDILVTNTKFKSEETKKLEEKNILVVNTD